MKKLILFYLTFFVFCAYPSGAQVSGILKKVKNSMVNEALGNNKGSADTKTPEPACACDPAESILDLGGKIKLDYTELSISVIDDGSILLKDKISGKYYISKGSVTQGPYSEGDPRIAQFEITDEGDNSIETLIKKNKEYISRSGDKYLITFNGIKYGPYAQISMFAVPRSKDKFAAIVVENLIVNDDQGKKMEEAMKNAKTDQEKMDLSIQYGQQMANKMMQQGGPESSMPKLVTNVPGATYDPMKTPGGTLNGKVKYDEILMTSYDRIMDLQGKTIITLKQENIGASELYLNTSNTIYATAGYGTLSFSDGKKLSELFNPHLLKTDGKVYLAYMYYSPKKNSIMRCKILF